MLSTGEKLVNIISGNEDLALLISRIYDEVSKKCENYKIMVRSLVGELITLLLRHYKNSQKSLQGTSFSGKTAELIAPALAKIFRDYSKPISVEELASLCGVSKFHFCRVFKKEMKLTVVEYINNYRLSVAEILLKNDELSMEKIAASCGFNDASYFYRCYKKVKNKPLKRREFKASSN